MSIAPRPATMKIVAMCSARMEPFMRMLGIDEVYVAEETNLFEIFEKLVSRKDVAIVLTELDLYEKLRERLFERRELYPIFVAIPSPEKLGIVDIKTLYRSLIRRYVGLEVAL